MFEHFVIGARAYASAWLVLVVAAYCMHRYGGNQISQFTKNMFTGWAVYFTGVCLFNGLFSYLFNVDMFTVLWLDLILSAALAFLWRNSAFSFSFTVGKTTTTVEK